MKRDFTTNPLTERELAALAHVKTGRYHPTVSDIIWTRNMLKQVAQGGIMKWEKGNLEYRVDHRNKRILLTNVAQLRVPSSKELHEATIEVCKAVGYAVEEEPEPKGMRAETHVPFDMFKLEGEDPRGNHG